MKRKALKLIAKKIMEAEQRMQEFKEELDQNPAHALEWSKTQFKRAAELQIFKQAKEALEKPSTTVSQLLKHIDTEIHQRAKYISGISTSQTGNLMKVFALEACQSLYETLTEE